MDSRYVMGKPFPGENELLGSGVSYCATCDAQFFRGKEVAPIISKVFMGVHYEYLVETKYRNYKVHTTDDYEVGLKVGMTIDPFDIQVMYKMDY